MAASALAAPPSLWRGVPLSMPQGDRLPAGGLEVRPALPATASACSARGAPAAAYKLPAHANAATSSAPPRRPASAAPRAAEAESAPYANGLACRSRCCSRRQWNP